MKTFKPKICKMCGKEFIPAGNAQKYCGSYKLKIGCAYKIKRERQKIYEQIPEYKEKKRIHRQTLGYKKKTKIIRQLPENKEKQRIYRQWPKNKLIRYKKDAMKRGLERTLTDNEFYELFKQPCYYTGRTDEMGVDRVNNSIGYTKENSVPCCASINYMKGTLSKNEFFQLCKEVVIHNHLL